MRSAPHSQVKAPHLRRNAYLYIRQSSLKQVVENQESTQRQYALRQRALELGWPADQIVILDEDLGRSAASSDRAGFQKLVSEVGMGRAGMVMSLEVSRLARNSSDWHRLLEICALTGTLILDEEGLYDPGHFNDRLLLGLKGTMSEVELHLLRARLWGGKLNKARRGELCVRLPVGLLYDPQGQVGLDPDQQVQETLRLFFHTFRRVGSANGTVRWFGEQGHLFPSRVHSGSRKGELVWTPLRRDRALKVLHNPRYAGAYTFGKRQLQPRATAEGRAVRRWVPREDWHVLILDAHPGYITWEQYEEHERWLEENTNGEPGRSPPREGPALLQGLAVCGRCGHRLTVVYRSPRRGRLRPSYVCPGLDSEYAGRTCQCILGDGVDRAVGQLLVEAMSPMAIEVALAVQQELQERIEETDRLRQKQVQRARYEADLARRRYMKADPDHRLVAATLEAEWNEKLQHLAQAEAEYERRREADRQLLNEETQKKIVALASNFPKLWSDPRTPNRERKRMVRLLVEDITLIQAEKINIHIRFKGGATKTLLIDRPLPAWKRWQTDLKVVSEIDRLLNDHTPGEIAEILNDRGLVSGRGKSFNGALVARVCSAYNLKKRYDRLRDAGLLTLEETAERLGVHPRTVKEWRTRGRLKAQRLNDRGQYLYEEPPPTLRKRREASTNDRRGAV